MDFGTIGLQAFVFQAIFNITDQSQINNIRLAERAREPLFASEIKRSG